MNKNYIQRRFSNFQIIIMTFAGVILLGAAILMLPVSARSGRATSMEDALFTATSAVCVTGLVVKDTAAYWSPFGHVYHTHTDCQSLNQTETLTEGTVEQAVAANRTRLCKFCARQDSITTVGTDE